MVLQVQGVQHRAARTSAGRADAPARILIAGDHTIFRDGLRRLLETEADLQVIGEAGEAATTLQLVRDLNPDLLLFDLAMPDAGLDVLRALAATSKLPRTIILTGSIETKTSSSR
jgi:DNA-binding NarL/FixJ family response regulator